MDFFIGLVFDPNHLSAQKITSFRKRFDPKFNKGSHLQLTLIPPFSFPKNEQHRLNDFIEELRDLFDGHLHGLTNIGSIEFHGLEFHDGRKSLLGLNPKLPIDLVHCQDALKDILADYGVQFKNPKSVQSYSEKQSKLGDADSVSLKSFLTIGRFNFSDELESAVELARGEFPQAFTLPLVNICLFKNLPHQWIIQEPLYKVKSLPGHFDGHLLNWLEY